MQLLPTLSLYAFEPVMKLNSPTFYWEVNLGIQLYSILKCYTASSRRNADLSVIGNLGLIEVLGCHFVNNLP